MLALLSLIVGMLLGAALCVAWNWREARGKVDHSNLDTWTTFHYRGGVMHPGLARGGAGLIPGGGWRAVVHTGDGFERMSVVGWELIHRIDEEGMALDDNGTVARVRRSQLWAHCAWPLQSEVVLLGPEDDRLVMFLAPGEDASDDALTSRWSTVCLRRRDIEKLNLAAVEKKVGMYPGLQGSA